MPLKIIQADITKMQVDAIVNAANVNLRMGGGVCGAIFAAAGADQLQEECNRIGKCPVGESVITKGYALPARYIIHTVGPVWQGGSHNEAQLLYNCYKNSLELAKKHECRSIAFPLISTGIFGYPKEPAIHIAISAINEFLDTHEMEVYLTIYDEQTLMLAERIFATFAE